MREFIPYSRQNITQEDTEAVLEVLNSRYLTTGPKVESFEANLASKVKASYAVATNSATSALHIACMALNLGEGDFLWTSPITFVASANCGLYCGASIDFIDININTGLIDIEKLEKKLEIAQELDKLPKILIPVHLSGASCEMQKINELSNKYGFSIIEDASHALGGTYKSQPVGSCQFSDITVFSFHPVKIITTAEGGMATTNNSELACKMSELRSHGITKDPKKFSIDNPPPWIYEQQLLGYNYRMNDIQAALGLSQLKRLDQIVLERNEKLEIYRELIKSLPVKLLEINENVYSSVHLSVISLNNVDENRHRMIFENLRNNKIGVQLHYFPVHLQPFFRNLGFKEGQFPAAEEYSKTSLSIPLFPELKLKDQKYVVQTLDSILND